MKKFLQIFYLIILFALFCIYEVYENSGTKVIEVLTPVKFAIDMNNNGVADEGETICIPEIEALTSDLHIVQEDLIKALKISNTDAINAGFAGDNFAKQTLLNKRVKLEYTEKANPECKFANIIFDENKNYSDELVKSGFAIKDNKLLNPELFNVKLNETKKLDLVIVNRKSRKFHRLNCKFGLNSGDYEILPMKEALSKYEKCKYCIVRPAAQKKLQTHDAKIIDKSAYPEVFQTDGIKFIVSDYTNNLKPDNKCAHQLCKEVVSLINSTNSTLDMVIYDWNNIPEIINALNNAKVRGVKLRVIYDKRTGDNFYPETEEFVKTIENARSDEIEGSKTQTVMLMHNKFIISDRKKLLTGSMNFSTTGLSGFNANNIAIINSPEMAGYYTKEFNQMFEGKFHKLKEKLNSNNVFKAGNSTLTVYFSPQDKTVENALVPLINSAQNYIYLPVFVITHNSMTDALIKAHNRGVEVKIILDATATRTTHSTHSVLRNAGIPLKTENYAGKIHNKSMIIDDKYIVTGSMNFSNSGENKNDENCVIIENPELAKFYKGWFIFIWNKIPDKFLNFTARPESRESIGSCYDGIDNDYDGKIDFVDEGCRQ